MQGFTFAATIGVEKSNVDIKLIKLMDHEI